MLEQIGKNARQAALALNALGSPQKNLGLNAAADALLHDTGRDRKSTRLNSSH